MISNRLGRTNAGNTIIPQDSASRTTAIVLEAAASVS